MAVTLVSGGTGIVGRFIVEGLTAAGHDVVAGGRSAPPAGFFSAPTRFATLSLEPGEVRPDLFAGVDFFVHAAFDHLPGKYRGGEGSDPDGFVRRNLHGSRALFEAARAAGVRRAVFLSSRAVYGTQERGAVLTEKTEPHPDTLYGEVKLDAENAFLALADARFHPVVLRVTGVYGPAAPGREHKWTALFRDHAAGKIIEPRAGTEVHGDDVAQAVRIVLDAPGDAVSGEVFNVSDIVVDRRDLLTLYNAVADCGNGACLAADGSALNVMDTAKLRALGWQPGGAALLAESVRRVVRDAA